ncbi:MAG: glycosyltransferase [Planctomycetes bacterium]|nr:glycosyltransferase [Planctomycetota bacterium]
MTADRPTHVDTPNLSVILVADYAGGEAKSWEDLRRALRAWAAQNGPPPAEFILVESEHNRGRIPDDVLAIVPNMQVTYGNSDSSYFLKNQAAAASKGDWIALIDADCVPDLNWLEVVRAAITDFPDLAALSAKTVYPGRSRTERVLSLLSRCYLDPGRRGSTHFISGNAAVFRRDVYLRNPLPVGVGAFSSLIQSEAFHREGARLYFDPALVVVHDFEGWPMERDLRRNHGHCTVATRLHDPRIPHAGLVRAGRIAIPLIVAGKIWNNMRDSLRCYRQYDVKTYELPLALWYNFVVHLFEIPGMLAAYRGESVGPSAFR